MRAAAAKPRASPTATNTRIESHRGGPPGFVQVDGDTLTWPDYAGNNMFNTLGNLVRDPRAGLVFPDFATGALLSLTGSTTIEWAPERRIRFRIDAAITLHRRLPAPWVRASRKASGQR